MVADLGRVEAVERDAEGVRLAVRTILAGELDEGDSVAVNGVCLTATSVGADSFTAEVMNQTLGTTSLAGVAPGQTVNLELPLRATDRLGGHIVQGHVDGLGTITAVEPDGFSRRITIEAPPELLRYVVSKGAIALDGVSLTVAEAETQSFTVSLIPETLARTNLGAAGPGDTVNLEVDVLAKYVERLMAP